MMLGFSIYLAVIITTLAAGKALDSSVGSNIMWVMAPVAGALCQLVWTYALWDISPARRSKLASGEVGANSHAVALELRRFNGELSKFWQR
jgi:hypothetical protein